MVSRLCEKSCSKRNAWKLKKFLIAIIVVLLEMPRFCVRCVLLFRCARKVACKEPFLQALSMFLRKIQLCSLTTNYETWRFLQGFETQNFFLSKNVFFVPHQTHTYGWKKNSKNKRYWSEIKYFFRNKIFNWCFLFITEGVALFDSEMMFRKKTESAFTPLMPLGQRATVATGAFAISPNCCRSRDREASIRNGFLETCFGAKIYMFLRLIN